LILGRFGAGANHLQDQAGVISQPALKERFPVIIAHRSIHTWISNRWHSFLTENEQFVKPGLASLLGIPP
jgi:hypothetical protein